MSILYKTFLFYNDVDNNLHYIGPYNQKGQLVPIYTAVGTYCGDVIARNMSERLDEISFCKQSGSIDVENIKKTIEEYSSQTITRCFLCSMKDINCFKSETKGNYEGYIHNSLKRYMDLQHYDKEEHDAYLSNYIDSPDADMDDLKVISTEDYAKMSKEEQKKFVFDTWKDEWNPIFACEELKTVITNWLYILDIKQGNLVETLSEKDIILLSVY